MAFLFQIYHEDSPDVGRPDDWSHRVRAQQELHPPRHQARQLPHGDRETLQQIIPHRFRTGQKIQGQQDQATHSIQVGI